MEIKKLGQIKFKTNYSWQENGIITPTPYILNDDLIRVYCGFRDCDGISRIGYIDLDQNNPLVVKGISQVPVLDIGNDGCFDDNGMILGDIKEYDKKLYMFYVGFQLVNKVKFLAYSGLAVSSDGGNTFIRVKNVPILDRAENAKTIKAIHSVNNIDGQLYAYYAVGDGWETIESGKYPQYESYCSRFDIETLTFYDERKCISNIGNEYRIGKPTVYNYEDKYLMFYTRGRKDDLLYYEPGIALSDNGIDWIRSDNLCPIFQGNDEWDNLNTAYPRIVENKRGVQYIFYSGNSMGADGFGVAEIINGHIKYSQEIER